MKEDKEYSKLTTELLEEYISDVFEKKKDKSERNIVALTGKKGAISAYKAIQESAGLNRPFDDRHLREHLAEGAYTVGSSEGYVVYSPHFYDESKDPMKDTISVLTINGDWHIERWKGQNRTHCYIIHPIDLEHLNDLVRTGDLEGINSPKLKHQIKAILFKYLLNE